jgi:hypothetical protein
MLAAVLAGLADIAFAVFHLMFWRLFGWPATLWGSGRLNAVITQTLNIVLIYVFAVYGGALLWYALSGPGAPSLLLWAGAGFWALRLALQLMLFENRKGKYAVATVAFAVATLLHGLAAWSVTV